MSSKVTCFENLVGKRERERILPKTLSFLPIKNSMHSIMSLYLHEKFEKGQMISVTPMGHAGPQLCHSGAQKVVHYYAVRCILFSLVFTYLNVSPFKKKSVLT